MVFACHESKPLVRDGREFSVAFTSNSRFNIESNTSEIKPLKFNPCLLLESSPFL
jgi:hypothetical protein